MATSKILIRLPKKSNEYNASKKTKTIYENSQGRGTYKPANCQYCNSTVRHTKTHDIKDCKQYIADDILKNIYKRKRSTK